MGQDGQDGVVAMVLGRCGLALRFSRALARRGGCLLLTTILLLLVSGAVPAAAATGPAVVHKGLAACRDIALTYDVEFGPTTQRLADNLDDLGVRSTWFLVGDSVTAHPELVRQVAARHQIANHTYTHPYLTKLTSAQVRAELTKARTAITAVIGHSPEPFWRPPYGAYHNEVVAAAAAADYPQAILWSIDTRDWAGSTAETLRDTIVDNAFPGAIVLMHGFPPQTPVGTRMAVAALRARGYQFLTVSELLGRDRDQRDFGGDTYAVQSGDSMGQIARCHNVDRLQLQAFNEVTTVAPGYTLRIPHPDEVIVRVQGVRQNLPIFSRMHGGQPYAHYALAGQLGAQATFAGGRIIITATGLRLEITPGQSVAKVNGTAVRMDGPALAEGEHVLLPVRFLAAQLGAWVGYNVATHTVQVLH